MTKNIRFTNLFHSVFFIPILLLSFQDCKKQSASNINISNKQTVLSSSTNKSQNEVVAVSNAVNTAVEIVEPIFGITIDTIPSINSKEDKRLKNALNVLKEKRQIVIRVNIDPNEKVDKILDKLSYEEYKNKIKDELDFYETTIQALKQYGAVMVNVNDSHGLYFYKSENAYRMKMRAYLERLGNIVDVWEIGNEVNGNWAGWKTNDDGEILEDDSNNLRKWKDEEKERKEKRDLIGRQIAGAYQEVINYKQKPSTNQNIKTALTLYYFGMEKNKGCRNKGNYEMDDWVKQNINEPLKTGIDYVFISVYEDDEKDEKCTFIPDDRTAQIETFNNSFRLLSETFNSDKTKFGFGEFAPQFKMGKKRCEECKFGGFIKNCVNGKNKHLF